MNWTNTIIENIIESETDVSRCISGRFAHSTWANIENKRSVITRILINGGLWITYNGKQQTVE